MFWSQLHLYNLPDLAGWPESERRKLVSVAMVLVMLASIAGNFVAAWLARRLGDRRTIALMCLGYFLAMVATYATPRGHASLMVLLPGISVFSGLFALFTMYLPPLFPTLLRTTGAGFCYNIGRVASAVGTVVFGLISTVHDYRTALIAAGCLFVPRDCSPWACRSWVTTVRDGRSAKSGRFDCAAHFGENNFVNARGSDGLRPVDGSISGTLRRKSSSRLRRKPQSLVRWLSRSKSALLM